MNAPAIPEWSPRGVYRPSRGDRSVVYEHVTVDPCAELVATCNACGRPNYRIVARGGFDGTPVSDDYAPNGLRLLELGVTPNGYQRSVTRLCPECAMTVGGKLTAAAESLGARWSDVVRAYDAGDEDEKTPGRSIWEEVRFVIGEEGTNV